MSRPKLPRKLLADLKTKTDIQMQHPTGVACVKIMGREKAYELLLSGNWLFHELTSNGCGEWEARSCCFAHGQRSVGACPWEMAEQVFRAWKEDLPLVPIVDD